MVFTIRTRVTPLAVARAYPTDASRLAALLRTMSPQTRADKGLPDAVLNPVLVYLDGIGEAVQDA